MGQARFSVGKAQLSAGKAPVSGGAVLDSRGMRPAGRLYPGVSW